MPETKKEVLKKLHDQENGINKEMGIIDKKIKELNRQKAKLKKRVSGNMLLRNKVINWEDNH